MPLIFDTSSGSPAATADARLAVRPSAARALPVLAAGMQCLVVPRQLGWTDVGTWTRLERCWRPARPSCGPACSSTPRTSWSPAWTGGRSSRSAQGLIVVTHEDAVYVLDKQKALDAGTLEQLRSLLAASTRKDLL